MKAVLTILDNRIGLRAPRVVRESRPPLAESQSAQRKGFHVACAKLPERLSPLARHRSNSVRYPHDWGSFTSSTVSPATKPGLH